MSIYQLVKEKTVFLDVLEHYIGPLEKCGDYTYTTEEDECPLHGGHGCFRIKDDGEEQFVNCFGNCEFDEWPCDIIEFVRRYKELETPREAVELIAKDFNVDLPKPNPVQLIMNFAAGYYHRIYEMDISKHVRLGKRSPAEFQVEVRDHHPDSLKAMRVGWSDGRLWEALDSEGFTKEEVLASGLVSEDKRNGNLRDFLPDGSFIYPHYWEGRVSRFTFKHMPEGNRKRLEFQMKKMNWINGVEWLIVGSGAPYAIVEGENDLASILDTDWPGTVLCCNGSISRGQIEWLVDNIPNEEIHTFFDADPAGEKYTDKLWKPFITGKLTNLHQWALPEGDVDAWLCGGKTLEDLRELQPPERDAVIDVVERAQADIVEETGVYKIIKISKDGETETRVPISDFTIKLLYVKVLDDERCRVIKIRRRDGRWSKPVVVNSEAKVSLRHWKILVANAVDASFIGNEGDLAAMWDYVYANQREAEVEVPGYVGDIGNGWLFGDTYVSHEGDIEGDEDNIMWLNEKKTKGISPKSLTSSLGSTNAAADIPKVFKGREMASFQSSVCHSLADIFKSPGHALMIMGWLRSCAYSMPMFYEAGVKHFPFLLLWGRHGKGKSTVVNWGLSMYDMADKGTTTVGQLRSGVGIERKLAYYRGLPYCIDELRADRQAMEYSRTWRGWYNRISRVKGTRKSEEIIQVPLNACLFFSGQDTFTDPAMRSRCIGIKFPKNAGDDAAYTWMEDNTEYLPTLGYEWIREAMESDIEEIKDNIDELKGTLRSQTPPGISSRHIANTAMSGYFAMEMAEAYFPEYDFVEFMLDMLAEEHVEANEADMTNTFWESIAGLQVGDRPPLNGNHLQVKDGNLHIWYPEVFRVVLGSARGDMREGFSKGAVQDALKEEPYYIGMRQLRLGATNTPRRCLTFRVDGDDVPDAIKEVAETSRNVY